MRFQVSSAVALSVALSLAACGGPTDDPTADTADTGGADDAISQRTPAYVRLTRDTRRCVSPLCGGFWAQDVNRTTAAVYVSGLDFSESGLDQAAQDLVAGAPGELLVRGRLGPAERRFSTRPLIVLEAYVGQPGITARTTDRYYTVQANDPPIQCITAPCNNAQAFLLNTGRAWAAFTGLDVRTVLVPFADEGWLIRQVEQQGALVAAHFEDGERFPGGRARLLVASQAFVRIGAEPVQCPLVRAAPCAAGEVYTSARSADRCLYPDGCAPGGQACPQFIPACPEGYTLASWASQPTGCPAFACDPAFTLPAETPVEPEPTPRCHHIRCAPGYHCENEGPEACVMNLTCANVLCAPGHRCVESGTSASCEALPWTSEATSIASRSPYANNTRQSWLFTSEVANSHEVRFSFTRFDLERGYDFVVVETTEGAELARYTGNLGAFTTDPFIGSSLRLRFVTDGSVTGSGFAIDRVDVR